MALIVNVTQEHIEKGVPGDLCHCPIALAVKEKFPSKGIVVGGETIEIEGTGYYRLPIEASIFIEEFDEGSVVEPLSFTAIEDDDY